MNNLYTLSQVSERLLVSVKTIRRLIDNQKLSAIKISGQWRISEDQLNEYLKVRTLPAKKFKEAI